MMPLCIGVPKETGAGEKRVALVPETVTKLKSSGISIMVESGAGDLSYFCDADYKDAHIAPTAHELFAQADVLLCVRLPAPEQIAQLKEGAVVIGHLRPYEQSPSLAALLAKKAEAYSVELIPRISRAQAMDALSSQAAVAGYLCAVIAASECPKFFPMLTYAAGSIRPARVLVIGAGVAGLQAIATARRLGAVVEAYDVRPSSKEEVESLGAKFVDAGVSAAGTGGYARELTLEEKKKQADALAMAVGRSDILITTAALPGRPSPRIVTAEMLSGMKRGSLVVDMAAEGGGNVEGTVAGETRIVGNCRIIGAVNLPSRMPTNASEMYSKNLYNFLLPHIKEGVLSFDATDEVLKAACLCRGGEMVSEAAKKAQQGGRA